MAWASIKRADEFEYPFVNFTNNNPAVGKSSWSGFSALLELFREQGGTTTSKKHDEWLKKQEAERAKREAARKAAEEKARKAEALVQGERLAYESAWHCGGRHAYQYEAGGKIRDGFVELIGDEDGSAPYLVAKGISDVVSRFQMKRMRDGHGYFSAVPLYNIDGLFLGLQRLYADKTPGHRRQDGRCSLHHRRPRVGRSGVCRRGFRHRRQRLAGRARGRQ